MRSAIVCSILALLSVASRSAHAEVVERVVATVGDRAIFLSELREQSAPLLARLEEVPASSRAEALTELQRTVLDRLIDERLIEESAARDDIRVSAQDVDRAIQNLMRQHGLEEADFWQAVAAQGYTPASYRADLRKQLLRYKLLNARVRARVNLSEADVRRVYDERVRAANRSVRLHAEHVFLENVDGDSDALLARAAEIHTNLTVENFSDAIAEHGGDDLGWLNERDLPEDLRGPLVALEAGQIGEPIATASGVHIFLVRERERGGDTMPSWEDARDQLYEEMTSQAMGRQEESFLRELRRGAVITRHL